MSRMSLLNRAKVGKALAAVGVTAVGLLVPWSASSASAPTPTVGLVGVLTQSQVDRYTGQNELFISPGVYVAALNGAFEIDANVASGGGVTLWQVQRSNSGAHRIRQITAPSPVSVTDGLPDFLDFTLTTARGRMISHLSESFCPGNFFGQARVDRSGPDTPTYPLVCGSVLSQAVPWGIDKGWGASVDVGMKFPKVLLDGTYSLTVAVNPAYASQLGVPAGSTSKTVSLAVTTVPACNPEIVCGPVPGAQRALGAPGTGSHPATVPLTTSALSGIPDLRALPAHDLSTEHNTTDGHDYLDFGATIWNGGTGPLDLEGFRSGQSEVMDAVQYVYSNGQPDAGHAVGQFEFDTRPGHNHWHMEDVAQYDLLDSTGRQVVLSEKQSFCLAPTDPINLLAPGADWGAQVAELGSSCQGEDAIWLREVLPAGWGDTYYQSVAGQSFDITTLPNGSYRVRITTDPNHTLLETSYTNNVGLLNVTLGGTTGHRTVTVA